MVHLLQHVFATETLVPHGYCILWKPALVLLHTVSDLLIALSYFSIPALLVYFVNKRRDVPFHWMFCMFGAFIVACGMTHIIGIWTLWRPVYWLDGFVKLITAVLSVATALLLVPLLPKALALPSLAATNAQLARTTKELERSNAELEQFAYIASHDLKAPLRGIDNLATWIAEDLGTALAGEALEHMQLLRGRVRRLEALLDDILEYSRVGRLAVQTELVDVGQLVTDLFEALNIRHNFSLALGNQLPVMITSRTRLEQVFANLFANAIKHHDGAHGQLQVSAQDHGEYYAFAVADDGPGIAPQYHDRVLQMFQRLKSRDEIEGSGMVLAIAKKIIEEQGGSIWIEYTTGTRGATFRFTWSKAGGGVGGDNGARGGQHSAC